MPENSIVYQILVGINTVLLGTVIFFIRTKVEKIDKIDVMENDIKWIKDDINWIKERLEAWADFTEKHFHAKS